MADRQQSAAAWRSPTVAALVPASLVPRYGVFALGWAAFPILLLFWLENVIVGAFKTLTILGGGFPATARQHGGAGDSALYPINRRIHIPTTVVRIVTGMPNRA